MKNQLKTIFLLGVLSVVLITIGGAIGPAAFWGMTALAIAMNLGAYFYSDRLVLRMHGARELAPHELPRLQQIVQELAVRAEIPTPRVFLMETEQPNAFATGRNPAHAVVAVTQGLIHELDARELRGVIAHELAHIKNRDILLSTLAAGLAAAIGWVANVVQFSAFFGGSGDDEEGGSPLAALALAFVAPVAAVLVQLGISRSREYLADETGAQICGDPEALARALEKLELGAQAIPAQVAPATASLFIVNPLAGGAQRSRIAGWLSTHPPMDERIRRLRALAYAPAAGFGRAA